MFTFYSQSMTFCFSLLFDCSFTWLLPPLFSFVFSFYTNHHKEPIVLLKISCCTFPDLKPQEPHCQHIFSCLAYENQTVDQTQLLIFPKVNKLFEKLNNETHARYKAIYMQVYLMSLPQINHQTKLKNAHMDKVFLSLER